MPSVARHAYLHVRIAALSRRLFSPTQLHELTEEELDTVYSSLHEAGLETDEDLGALSVQTLERLGVRRLADEALCLLRGVTGADRDLLRHWARRFELLNFKVIVRGKVAGWSAEQIEAQLFHLGLLEGLPVEALIHSEDVTEMLRRLEVGYYARMAHQARSAYEQGHSLFDAEAILDRAYLEDLMDHVTHQPRDERKALHRLLGPLLDQINLVWLLRYRFAYGLDPSHTYYLLGPGGEHIRHAMLMDLARPEEMEAVLERLPPVVRDQIGEEQDTGTIEATLSQRTENIAWQALRFHPFRLVEAVAYLLLRERQLIRLHGVVKGMRLGLQPETLREALLQEGGGGAGE